MGYGGWNSNLYLPIYHKYTNSYVSHCYLPTNKGLDQCNDFSGQQRAVLSSCSIQLRDKIQWASNSSDIHADSICTIQGISR